MNAKLRALNINLQGWCEGVNHVPSPNFNTRPENTQVSLLVIHNISLPPGIFGGSDINKLFTNTLDWESNPFYKSIEGLKVSAHFLISRDGEVTQFVSTYDRAWHAGESVFNNVRVCNDFSVGIELEGSDMVAFTTAQYESLTALTKALAEAHPISAVTGHEHIAPGRKTDPGPFFSWHCYEKLLNDVGLTDIIVTQAQC